MKRVTAWLAVLLGAVLAGNASAGSVAEASTAITVQGAVSCTHQQLIGVWVQSSGGGSEFASWSKGSNGGLDGVFKATITTSLPTTLSLHVGCGGSSSSWWSDNWTPGKSVGGSAVLEALCNEGTTKPAPGANTRCAFTPTGGESNAVAWAKSYLGKNYDTNLCLTFVSSAYSSTNVTISKFVNGGIGSNTYPQDVWGHITQNPLVTGGPGTTPPFGALVFFNAKSGYSKIYSHIELSLGAGNMISTSDTFKENQVHEETLAQHAASGAWNTYVGWWLPA